MAVTRRILSLLLAFALVGAAPAAARGAGLPPPTRTDPVLGDASASPTGPPTLTAVRTGRHDGFDRTVFDFTGGTPAFGVEYGPLAGVGTGDPIPVAGAATLAVTFRGAWAYDLDTGRPTIDLRRVYDPRLPTLRQIRSGGGFEGHILFGLGLNDRVGFRVLRLSGPPRIAVDVAHQPSAPFGTGTVWTGDGTAEQVRITGVRAGAHPGYDRVVFDLDSPTTPLISVSYTAYAPSTLHVGFTASTTRVGTVGGPNPVVVGLTQIRGVRFEVYDNGTVSAFVSTDHRTGFRVSTLTGPTRLVVDVKH
jgi:hypothetical protein